MAEQINVVQFRDFVDPAAKNEDWILKAVKDNFYHGGALNLLHGKKVDEIWKYAAGNHSMKKFIAMFPEPKKRKTTEATETNLDRRLAQRMGIDFEPLGILQQPLSSAVSTLQKTLVDIQFDAIDATANSDRKTDLDRIRNRPLFNQAIAGAKNILRMPLTAPQPQNNAPTVDIDNVGLDPQKEDELNLYADLFYKLRPEAAFEVATASLLDQQDFKEKLDLEKRDQVYFGVSSSRAYISDITGLPMYDYLFPGDVWAPKSDLTDCSDVPFLYTMQLMNVEQLLNCIGEVQVPEEQIKNIFESYWKAWGTPTKWERATETQKRRGVEVCYMEFKSFDVLRIKKFKTGAGRILSTVVPFDYKLNQPTGQQKDKVDTKWPQQTYYAYWVKGTDFILKSGKVLGSFRSKGKESKSRFTIQVEKSKEKSDVELCMTAVDDAQRAYIKLQQAVIMAKPRGQYIDMKYLRQAAEQLQDDLDVSVDSLLTLFAAHNIMIGDTEGLDGQNESGFLPFRDIPGGLGGEVRELMSIIQDSHNRINMITNYNGMTNQAPNPEGLVGIQKLALQSSVNSLYPAMKAARRQTEKTVNAWAPMIQYICRKENQATEARKALENIIGSRKIAVIDDMDSLSVHQFGIRIEEAPSEEQQSELRGMLTELVRGQRIDLSDYFLVRRVLNYKDAQQLLIIKEKKKAADLRQQQQEQNQAIQQAAQIRAQSDMQRTQVTAQGYVQEATIQSQTELQLFQQKAQLELQLKQIDASIEEMKKNLQDKGAVNKLITKANLDAQRQ